MTNKIENSSIQEGEDENKEILFDEETLLNEKEFSSLVFDYLKKKGIKKLGDLLKFPLSEQKTKKNIKREIREFLRDIKRI